MITSVAGFRVGHWQDEQALTGCTVILPPPGTTGSVHLPGHAPATRETDPLRPGSLSDEIHALVLTGGSAFGLGAVDGVMAWLEENGIGFETPVARIPIVPAAAIFDLGVGDAKRRPGPDDGRAACEAARADDASEGNVGAGMGATIGKFAGPRFASKGGVGQASARHGDVSVAALAVVNPVGEVIDEDGTVIAGARAEPPPGIVDALVRGERLPPQVFEREATTLVCVATDASMDKAGCREAAVAASAGLTRAIHPVSTMYDGDAVFVLASRTVPSPLDGDVAADVVAEAIRRAARAATDIAGIPARGRRER